jgi:L-seryl-tRNA(Ser) seleniumtransferase
MKQSVSVWFERISRSLTVSAVRTSVDLIRKKIRAGEPYSEKMLYTEIVRQCRRLHGRRIQPVINASGIILHTNMGRSPLPESAWDECAPVNTGYSNLELSLETGRRGKRNGLIPLLIRELTGAENSIVVNNNAAAVFLILSALAKGREVIVSRGEQVQIGGGFRIPEILKLSGAKLVEVGTTNITTLKDYTSAVTDKTAMVLKVHRSNFALRGFTSDPGIREIAAALPEGVLTVADQGSGVLNETLPGEKNAASLLKDGADLVSFSGDKVIGGPQAGIIIGKKSLIDILDGHPLIRTMRPGKTIYSLLESVLIARAESAGAGSRHTESVTDREAALQKCRRLKRGLSGDVFKVIDDSVCIGGGSTPDEFFDSHSIQIITEKIKPERIMEYLRALDPPVIGTIKDDRVTLNPAALTDSDLKYLKTVLTELEKKLK